MAAMKIPSVSGLCGIYSPNSGLQPIPLANPPSPNHPPPKVPGSLSKLTAIQARPAARLLHTIPLPDAENLPSLNHSCLVSQPSLPHPAPQSPSNYAATTHHASTNLSTPWRIQPPAAPQPQPRPLPRERREMGSGLLGLGPGLGMRRRTSWGFGCGSGDWWV